MDQVLTKFYNFVKKFYNLDKEYKFEEYLIFKQMFEPNVWIHKREEFFHSMSAEDWESLERMEWAFDLWKWARKNAKEVHALTLLPHINAKEAFVGKVKWFNTFIEELGSDGTEFCIPTFDKSFFAEKGSLLIDDRISNVEKFIKHGGDGLVFPCTTNESYNGPKFDLSIIK